VLAAVALPAAASAAAHRDQFVTSFDGVQIWTHFFAADGLKPGQRAPVVMLAHGYGERGPDSPDIKLAGAPKVSSLLAAGYHVFTWDARGHGYSGGTARIDDPDVEGRDTRLLIDHVARQPDVQLDGPGDPRLGMTGASYGGIIQYVVAGLDPRVDVIEPAYAPYSMADAVAPFGKFKEGWGAALLGAGAQNVPFGVVSGAGPQVHGYDPAFVQTGADGVATGVLSDPGRAYLDKRSASRFVQRIRVPTLLQLGTTDTLFTTDAVRSFLALKQNQVPVKLVLNCEGHSICLKSTGPADRFDQTAIAWFDRWLKPNPTVDTGPPFEWLADNQTTYRSAGSYPPLVSARLTGHGTGTLALDPTAPASGGGAPELGGTPAAAALTIDLPAPAAAADVVGAPHVTLTYTGSATPAATYLYAQLVDLDTNQVVGAQVTPIPITLDGAEHTIEQDLYRIATRASTTSRYQLQLFPGSGIYGAQRSSGTITIARASATLPIIDPAAAPALMLGRPVLRSRLARVRLQATLEPYHHVRVRLERRRAPNRWHHIATRTTRTVAVGATKLRIRLARPARPGLYRARLRAADAYGQTVTATAFARVRR